MSAETRNETPPEPPWTEQSSALTTAWLAAWQRAVQINGEHAPLFHPGAIVYGHGPFTPDDGLLRITFEAAMDGAKILPLDRAYTLVIAEWSAKPMVAGGEDRAGFATFVLFMTPPRGDRKGSVLCVHAHYSRKT